MFYLHDKDANGLRYLQQLRSLLRQDCRLIKVKIFFFTPILMARYLIATEGDETFYARRVFQGDVARRSRSSQEENRTEQSRTEQNTAKQERPRLARSLTHKARGPYAYAEPGPAYSDGEAHGERGVVPRHATRIRNEYKYIEGRARGTEKERHVARGGKIARARARVLVTSELHTHRHDSPLAAPSPFLLPRALARGPLPPPAPSSPVSRIGARRVPEYASVSARLQHAPRRSGVERSPGRASKRLQCAAHSSYSPVISLSCDRAAGSTARTSCFARLETIRKGIHRRNSECSENSVENPCDVPRRENHEGSLTSDSSLVEFLAVIRARSDPRQRV